MDEFMIEMDGLNELVYLSDPDTYELLYLNECGLAQFGMSTRSQIAGRKCYEVLQNRTSPCDFCTNGRLCKEKFYEWDIENAVTGHNYMLKDKLVDYQGKTARMEIALDVTRLAVQERQIKTLLENEQIAMECARGLQDTHNEAQSITKALAILGTRLHGARTYIFEFRDKVMDNTYEWCAPGVTAELENLQNVPAEVCHHWIKAFRSKSPYVITDIEEHKETEQDEYARLKPQGIHSLIVVPLFEQKKLIGFMGVDNPPLANGSNIVEILQLLAYFIQVALTRIKANERLRRMTFTDDMTGVKNRNAYIHDLEKMNAALHSRGKSRRRGSVGVVFVDANGLKELNDTAGHEAGDKLLIKIAQKITVVFPASQVYRTGGDEFVVLCDEPPEGGFLKNAEKLKQSLWFPQKGCNDAAVGICWSDEVVYMEEVINQAEADMYESKRQYYADNGDRQPSMPGNMDPTTSLLIKDRDVAAAASELFHLFFEQWDEVRLNIMLDTEFAMFDDDSNTVLQHDEAVEALHRQFEKNPGQTVRDLRFSRKRIMRGISVVNCCGRVDWKADDGKNLSIPFEYALLLVQKKGRIKCVYMHGTNITTRKRYAFDANMGKSMIYLNTIEKMRDSQDSVVLPDKAVAKDIFDVLETSFLLFSQEYTDVYLVDVQDDCYIAMKAEQKFHDLVGAAGNYTCVNRDYAEHYMDEENLNRYLDFTDRKNLLQNWRRGITFMTMRFAITRDAANVNREVEIDIWLGNLHGGVAGILAFRNITGQPAVQFTAEKDSLTGLLSYERFRENGQKLIGTEAHWALVSTDIQNFKYVNEVLSYQEGDNILRMFASNLLFLEGEDALHARVTGDRFLTLIACGEDQRAFAGEVRRNIDSFVTLQKQRNEDVKIVLRTGIYFLEKECKGIDMAIDRANLARQSVGQTLTSETHVYSREIVEARSVSNEILGTMEKALDNGDFQVWMQPKVDLRTGKLCGAEALVRWMRDGKVLFYPDEFIPIFENSGFVTSLDFYVLEETCRCMLNWQRRGWQNISRISVNLSAVDVLQGGVANAITNIVDSAHLPHELLEFELTETAYFKNSTVTAQVMEQLKREGFVTSVDDFGSGYSVMNMLINMPASVVKIDRMFMLNSIKTPKGCTFLKKIIGMIHELGYRVLCEGIETKEQFELLRGMDCDEGQGYYFDRPLPTEDFFTKYASI